MAETSAQATNTSTPKAVKDRNCPFCQQAFTSSSLGRHLDIYIKPKNPKPSDGIHIVEEIRKIRGSVTRRQARGTPRRRSTAPTAATPAAASQGSRASEDAESSIARSPPPQRTPASSTIANQELDGQASAQGFSRNLGTKEGFGRAGFEDGTEEALRQAVGRRGSGLSLQSGRQDGTTEAPRAFGEDGSARGLNPGPQSTINRQAIKKHQLDVRQRIQDALDTAKAAELALREMIGSWRAAKQHVDATSMPFDFDPLSMDFPALTLRCLEPPPTLFSSVQHTTQTSWSVFPPGRQQLEALRKYFEVEFGRWKATCGAATTAISEELTYPPSVAEFKIDSKKAVLKATKAAAKLEQQVYDHIQSTFQVWNELSQEQRMNLWVLELARNFGRKQKEMEKLNEVHCAMKQENAHLKSQVEQLSRLQYPREFKIAPPSTIFIDPKMVDHVNEESVIYGKTSVGLNISDRHSDLNTIVSSAIDRWKGVVVSSRASNTSLQAQRALSQAHSVSSPGATIGHTSSTHHVEARVSLQQQQQTPSSLQSPPLSQPPSATMANSLVRSPSAVTGPSASATGGELRAALPVNLESHKSLEDLGEEDAEADEGEADADADVDADADADADTDADADADADADGDAEMEDDNSRSIHPTGLGSSQAHSQYGLPHSQLPTRQFATLPTQQTLQLEVSKNRGEGAVFSPYGGIGMTRSATQGAIEPQYDKPHFGRSITNVAPLQGIAQQQLHTPHGVSHQEPIPVPNMGIVEGMNSEPMYID